MKRPLLPRPRTMLISLLATVLALVLVIGLGAAWTVRRPFPTYGGELTLAGLSAPVTVYRDDYGIPHIYAATAEDLFRAQGYVHAQDRFWEMDFRRHVTAGRLSELFGENQLETDTFLRTLGWRRVAEAEWELASPDTRRYLTAYAEGVNAWIEATGGPAATSGKALQYAVIGLQRPGYEIEPWHPVDSLAWLKAMAWDLRANMVSEQGRAALLAAGLTREQVEALYPPYPHDRHAAIVPEGLVVDGAFDPTAPPPAVEAGEDSDGVSVQTLATAAPALAEVGRAVETLPALLGPAGAGLGSNSWVVSGALTDTGAPILVNDPHLSPSAPSIWYQMGLHCDCGYRVAGFTFSGLPGVVIGHNDRIAWGFTNLAHDVADFYLERIDGDRYEVDGRWRDLEVIEETIRVAGGEDVTVTVRLTHHGPLLSDVNAGLREIGERPPVRPDGQPVPAASLGGYGVSLAWTALTPGRTIEALFALNQARDFDEFRAAAALFEVPAQNLLYADVDGNIGYQAPGRVPVRGAGDGRWPAPGWDSAYDWTGFVPFEQLPYVFNPDSGRIVTANQAVVGPQYQPWLSEDWSYGHRSARIHALLDEAEAAGPIGVAEMERMVFDSYNSLAPVLVPHLLAAPRTPLARDEQAALELLRDWDFQQPAGGAPGTPEAASSAAAAYFNAVWRHLLALLFDELPDSAGLDGGGRWFEVVVPLLEEPDSPWWDRVDTSEVETRDDVLSRALADAYRELAIAYGDDPTGWRWGELHTLTVRDGSLGSSGIAPIEALFNRGPVGTSGGTAIVNATGWDAAEGYEVTVVPSMRMVVDLSDLDASRWVQLTGNSGHAYHPHYTDQLELWRTGAMLPMRWERATIESEAAHTLTLTPPA